MRRTELPVGDVLELRIRQGTGLLRPWWGTMTHGIFHVGEPGAGIWRARTRPRLVRKMAKAAAGMGVSHGADRVLIEVVEA